MPANFRQQLWRAMRDWWGGQLRDHGVLRGISLFAVKLWEFVRESMPARQRQRYGDMEYDWEKRVNTTSGTVGWRERLLGLFYSPYQPTEPGLFHEMMGSLPIEFEQFTFVDLGSGKGRTLLMASEYPFRRIVGVELIAELHRAAEENILAHKNPAQRCQRIESVLGDVREFEFPQEPLLLYLFNPLPQRALGEVLQRLHNSLTRVPRPVWVVYHNPLLEDVLRTAAFLEKAGGTHQYSVYRATGKAASE